MSGGYCNECGVFMDDGDSRKCFACGGPEARIAALESRLAAMTKERETMKLSKRKRYWLKWNGPDWNSKSLRSARATMGHGDALTRFIATVFVCRHRGFYPQTDRELQRLAGLGIRRDQAYLFEHEERKGK